MTLRKYLEARLDKSGPCWLWTLSCNTSGYGSVSLTGLRTTAHRLAYEVYVGPIPEGLHVCHTCDNPRCCNPEHLFLGTHAENMEDKVRKGRQARLVGTRNPSAKLSEAEVLAIRERCGTESDSSLAQCFGVSRTAIRRIRTERGWNGCQEVAINGSLSDWELPE